MEFVKKTKKLIIAIVIIVFFLVLSPNKTWAKEVTVSSSNFTDYFELTGDNGHIATWDGSKVTLTEDKSGQVGGFYLKKRIDTTGSFTLKGKIYLGDKTDKNLGGDGMSFIFHPNRQDLMGESGGSLGMSGIPNVKGFRVDTYYNEAKGNLPEDWPSLIINYPSNPYREGKAGTPFGGFASTNDDGLLAYDYDSNFTLDKNKFLVNNAQPQEIAIIYNKDNNSLSIELDGKTKSRNDIDTGESLAFQVQASTGDYSNEQYFIFDSFTFDETRKITVKEIWDHGDISVNLKGGFTLIKNGVDSEEKITDSGDEVITSVDNLEEIDEQGEKILYDIRPKEVDGYKTEIIDYDEDSDTYTIKRTYIPNVKTLNVKEIWSDENNRYGLRPETSGFSIYANDQLLNQPYETSNRNDWAQDITVDKNDIDGNPINYTIQPNNPTHYKTIVTGENGSWAITHTLERVVKLVNVPELLQWTNRTIPKPNSILNRDDGNEMTVTVMDTTSGNANWRVTAAVQKTDDLFNWYSLIWKDSDTSDTKNLEGQTVLTKDSVNQEMNRPYNYEKTWGTDAGILLKSNDYVPIGEYENKLVIRWTLDNTSNAE